MTARARLGKVQVGDGFPVRIMAAINLSPESYYRGSVAETAGDVEKRVRAAVDEGADLIDIGGASTAPYLDGGVTEEVEKSRVLAGVRAAVEVVGLRKAAISVDTVRASVADAALRSGASVVNDVSGLKGDPAMSKVVRERGASLLGMAHSSGSSAMSPIPLVSRALRGTLRIAEKAGIDERLVVLDPGIGFFRNDAGSATSSQQTLMPWYEWDCEVIANLEKLRPLGRPIGVALSRKSFLGKILGLERPEERLAGSLAVTAIAVTNGAHLVRTHDVRETLQAVRAAEAVKAKSRRAGRTS
ncbi:MAG TPA: dihydropteroate synthase [Nitrososphaerales archaeon]|nr:dihydropteroate synthase [Nitrososphaerales archaeon]